MFENIIRVACKGKTVEALLAKLKDDIKNGDIPSEDLPAVTIEGDPLSGVTLAWFTTTEHFESVKDELLATPCKMVFMTASQVFKENRKVILDSVSWMHERYQSQVSLINAGEAVTAEWTSAQGLDYYRWKQALRVLPQSGDGWDTSITYPQVPQHVYDGMTDEIQELCTTLGCAPSE